jgi:hypothetical protein
MEKWPFEGEPEVGNVMPRFMHSASLRHHYGAAVASGCLVRRWLEETSSGAAESDMPLDSFLELVVRRCIVPEARAFIHRSTHRKLLELRRDAPVDEFDKFNRQITAMAEWVVDANASLGIQ